MVQVVEMSHEEKIKMYNKLSKKELISMLIEANNQLSHIKPQLDFQIYDGTFTVQQFDDRGNMLYNTNDLNIHDKNNYELP